MASDTVLLHSSHAEQFPGSDRDLLLLDRPASTDALARITSVQLWAPPDDPLQQLPPILAAMTSLRSLTISGSSTTASVISQAAQGDLPAGLEELHLHQDYLKVLAWPDVVMPSLRTLSVAGRFRFDNASFPALTALSIQPDRPLRIVRQAMELELTDLTLLNVPVEGDELFPLLAQRPLRRLGLISGTKLTGLDGIERLRHLEELRLKNLRNLTDIAALRTLPALRRLDLQYCKRIANIEVLNDLDALQRLTLVGCGDLGLAAVQQRIEGLEQATIGATR
ncbi:leucine-rich repeat domain-containing protein [Nocardioides dubius]|uniref:Leucine-rich repeat domain-containing protein n=1 Tax=Nocardioides dubius TaxID=317019 RepID=A0ABP4EF67_9ACTN